MSIRDCSRSSAPRLHYHNEAAAKKSSAWGGVAASAFFALFAAGCAVGPNFQTPAPPTVGTLTPSPLPMRKISSRDQQVYVKDLQIAERWWELFHCKPLDAVVARAIDGNPDLDAAGAAVRIANANTEAARGSFFSQIGASFGSSSQKPSAAQSQGGNASQYSLSTGQLSVSFVPDVFGLTRRQVESLSAQAEAQLFELEATYLTLTSKIALAAVEEASLRAQIRSADASIAIASEVLDLLKKQLEVNEASRVDVAAQEVALTQFQQQRQSLVKRLASNRDLMIALTGHFAGEGLAEKFEFSCLGLPAGLPISLPASIVRKRPDVRAAEANMHAATAEIGVAIANRLPQFNLTANAGSSGAALAKLASFSSPLLFWSIAGSAAATLFDGLSSLQKQRAAEADLERSAALYRSAVITAFQNVADVLQAVEADRLLYLAADRGIKSAQLNLDLTRKLLAQGQTSMLQVLSAQQLFAQAAASHAQAKAARLSDTVLLFQALGGGWKDRVASVEAKANLSSAPERVAYGPLPDRQLK